jgi:hypothetical protein
MLHSFTLRQQLQTARQGETQNQLSENKVKLKIKIILKRRLKKSELSQN